MAAVPDAPSGFAGPALEKLRPALEQLRPALEYARPALESVAQAVGAALAPGPQELWRQARAAGRGPEAVAVVLLGTLLLAVAVARGLPLLGCAVQKVILYVRGTLHFVLSRDKAWKRPADPKLPSGPGESKTIVFIRHGESTWNEVFNKGKNPFKILARLFRAIVWEIRLFLDAQDSCFYDSPLSDDGFEQSMRLMTFLEAYDSSGAESPLIAAVRGDPDAPRVALFTSPLRRCVSTALVGLSGLFLRQPHLKVVALSCLQEMTRNVDGICLTPARTPVTPSYMDRASGMPLHLHNFGKVDVSRHTGNKRLGSNGLKRLQEFAEICFESPLTQGISTLVVAGHSLWIKSFFDVYLPKSVTHVSRKKKVKNCGAVALTFTRHKTSAGYVYSVDPYSIRPLYLGFQG